MRQVILDFPKQFKSGLKAAKKIKLKNLPIHLENIIICGMGGSGLPGDILATLRPFDVYSYKSYNLPPQAGIDSLIFCISYSGNTEEAVSALQTAINRKLAVIAISTGGKLEELAKKHHIPHVKLPAPYVPPRLALGEMLAALLQLLINHNLLDKELVKKTAGLAKNLKIKDFEEPGKMLAKRIYRKIPFVYVSRRFMEVAWIWKNSLNETAKVLAFANYFPELNHNETVGFSRINEMQISNKDIRVLIIRDPAESHPRLLKQMQITKALIEEEGIETEFIDMRGGNMLEKIFSTVALGFWTAYWLALEYGVDPTEIKIIEEFKKRLKG